MKLGIAPTLLAAAACLSLTACGTSSGKQASPNPASSPPSPATSASGKQLPNEVGKGLSYADNELQTAGFTETPHDASGRNRTPIDYGNWVVCFQSPKAGSDPAGTAVNLGVVKTGEGCPTADQNVANPQAAGAAMPNFVGKSASTADADLPNASITWNDVSGQGRIVINENNWRICSQSPKAGAAYNGVPVTFGVVKYGESCP